MRAGARAGMLGAVQCTVFAALTAVIRDHPMNISGLVPHRATVGLAVATVARAAGDTTRPCAGANASRRIVAATRIEEGWKVLEPRVRFYLPLLVRQQGEVEVCGGGGESTGQGKFHSPGE